jgi:hypothetical protein
VSFDVFLQAFRDGDSAPADADAVRDVLAPYVSESDQSGFARLVTPDGGADLYGYDSLGSGFVVNHIRGDDTWEALVRAAKVSGLAILPIGCPTCVTSGSTIADLPEDLASDVRLVETGAELRSVVEEAE